MKSFLPFIFILFASCAQIVNPTGGPKDVTPPVVLKMDPENASVNFKSQNIEIEFDEFIQIKDLSSQLIVSPPVATLPDVRTKGRTLLITFADSLKENKTYSLNFGNAIRDITEDNALNDFSYVFSTGFSIDSLSLSGKVTNALKSNPEKGFVVMLFRETDSFPALKGEPDHVARTKDNGDFIINHLSDTEFHLVALQDKNGNFKYDAGEEAIAFLQSPVSVPSDSIRLFSFIEPASGMMKKATHPEWGKFVFPFGPESKKPTVKTMDKVVSDSILYEWNKKRDTLIAWTFFERDTLRFLRSAENFTDTVIFRMIRKKSALNTSRGQRQKLTLKTSVSGGFIDFNDSLKLEFSYPLKKVDVSAIQLAADSLPVPFFIEKGDSMINRKWTIHPEGEWKQDTSYQLIILPGVVEDIFGNKNDTMKVLFKVRELKFYGTAKVNLELPEGNYILEMLKGDQVISSRKVSGGKTTVNYEYLDPEKFRLRIIEDQDGNGQWTPGNYVEKLQPEKTIYYPGILNVRSNWDLEVDFKGD